MISPISSDENIILKTPVFLVNIFNFELLSFTFSSYCLLFETILCRFEKVY